MGLLVSLAGNAAFVQAANDPPVHVYTAHVDDNGANGGSTTNAGTVSTTTPKVLTSVTTTNLSAAHTHVCLVTASADAVNTSFGTGFYTFGLSKDTTASTVAASDRNIHFVNTTDVDSIEQEVSTTYAFTGISGSHTFYLSARKNGSVPNIGVAGASITVVCVKKAL